MVLKESIQIIENIFKDSIIITSFVMVTMLIIEYVSVHSKGNWLKSISNAGWLQIILSASLGVLPGCFGAFTAVSLYTHGIINFAGLVTAMIAATGDEAFVMLAMIPGSAIKLFIIVFCIAIVVGLILNAFMRKQPRKRSFQKVILKCIQMNLNSGCLRLKIYYLNINLSVFKGSY